MQLTFPFHTTGPLLWLFNPIQGLQGTFTIQFASDPSLYITAPQNPESGYTLYLNNQIRDNGGNGVQSTQQIWRTIPINGTPSSWIQNYAEPGLVIEIQDADPSHPSKALQLKTQSDSPAQVFFPQLTDNPNTSLTSGQTIV